MSLSACEKCWETPCSCGYDNKKYDIEYMSQFVADILQYRSKTQAMIILGKALEKITANDQWQDKTEEHDH